MNKAFRSSLACSRRGPHRTARWLVPHLCALALVLARYVGLGATPEANSGSALQPPSATNQASAQVPPPSSAPKLGQEELEKLLMPIALYPDPLLATVLPASVFPLEIVQAARLLQDTNNAAKIDEQPWDETVKALARIPDALKKLNDDLPWTIKLGEAFLAQDKEVMDTIQALRLKAQSAGTLRNSEQQNVIVTNMIVEKTVEQEVVVVTNTVVQIQPSNPQVVYVPSYPPTVYAPPPGYVYNPYAPLITFTAGVAMGAIIANNCDWHHGGVHWGGNDIDIERNANINVNQNVNNIRGGNRVTAQGGSGKWQPDQSRLRSSGSTGSPRTMESRGWSSGNAPSAAATRAQAQGTAASRVQGAGASSRAASSSSRPAASSSATPRAGGGSSFGGGSAASRPAVSSSSSGAGRPSAFSSGGSSRYSQRGSASRSGGSFGGGGRAGGGGRGGGGRR